MVRQPQRKRARRGRGEGTIYYDERKNLYVTQISLGYDGQGKRVRPTVYGKTKREVQEKLVKLQQNFQQGNPVKPTRVTVREHFEDWLSTKEPPITRPATYNKYRNHVVNEIVAELGSIRLDQLEYRTINRFYKKIRQYLGVRTAYDVFRILNMGLNDAVMKRLIPFNPANLAVKPSKGRSLARAMPPDEVVALETAIEGERLGQAFMLAIHTGLRPGELLGLPWDAIDFKGRTIKIFQSLHEEEADLYIGPLKTDASYRTITIGDEAIAALKKQRAIQNSQRLRVGDKWRDPEVEDGFSPDLVFRNHYGGLLRRTNVAARDLKRAIRKATLVRLAWREGLDPKCVIGVYDKGSVDVGFNVHLDGRIYTVTKEDLLGRVTLHVFRHTHVSMLIASGMDLQTIADRVGHEDPSITLRIYSHMIPGQDEKAAEKMDEMAASWRLAVDRQ